MYSLFPSQGIVLHASLQSVALYFPSHYCLPFFNMTNWNKPWCTLFYVFLCYLLVCQGKVVLLLLYAYTNHVLYKQEWECCYWCR